MAASEATEAQGAEPLPCPKIHLALLLWSLLPNFIQVNANVNVVVTASLAVLAGSWRSVKDEPVPLADRMSKQDAIRMPLVGSVVLFSLFVVFTFLPKDLVNVVLSGYFLFLGTFALTGTMLPFINPLFPKGIRDSTYDFKIKKVPVIMTEDTDVSFTLPDVVGFVLSSAFCIWYCLQKHWYATNALGLAFSIQGIEYLSLGSFQNGAIMLVGLFVYDIFWVFFTPVMVTVAKSFDAPIKLLFPRGIGAERQFSMLGLGDIVVPGIFVALMLRYDVEQGKLGVKNSSYFHSVFWGYVAGLVTTIVVMNVFQAAQPALLYIVPAVLGAVFLHAASRGEIKKVFAFEEKEPEVEEDEKQGEQTAADSVSKAEVSIEEKKGQ